MGGGHERNRPRATGRVPSAGELARAFVRGAADLLLPVSCISCDRPVGALDDGIICGLCWTLVRPLPSPRCDRCGHPTNNYACQWCPLLPRYVRAARSWCWIGPGNGSNIVHAFKYEGWQRAATQMASRMSRMSWPVDVVLERTAVVPVPLAKARERERGFNQCAVLGSELAKIWKIPAWNDALERSRSTRSQTELTPGERKGNVAGAFRVREERRSSLGGSHIMLVDDIITTGATLAACSSALFAAGARTISYITFGRAPSSGDRV